MCQQSSFRLGAFHRRCIYLAHARMELVLEQTMQMKSCGPWIAVCMRMALNAVVNVHLDMTACVLSVFMSSIGGDGLFGLVLDQCC